MDAQGQAMETDQAQIDSGHDTASASDSFISRVAVDAKLATPDEIRRCKSKQEEFKSQGKEYKLSSIMVKAGVITASQLRRLMNPADSSVSQSLQQIPGFQILQKIGAGAMASVYKARQLSLDRIVAIKILPKRLSEDPEFVERFYKEGQAAAKLNHNNIVQAIDVGEHGGYHYFVMEYVDGETVYDELVKNRIYPEERALDLITQIAKALEHAHAKGLIHRDVKPKNIMLTTSRVAKLADMGLAREMTDVEAAMAEAGRAYGTPYYISPEQIRGQVDIDHRADIYSLGATIYHMVTGRVPFEAPTPSAVMHKHLKETLIPPDHLNTSLTAGCGAMIEMMMAKDRDQRYPSARELLIDMDLLASGQSPRFAQQRLDHHVLETLADGEETVRPRDAAASAAPANSTLGVVIGLSVLLVMSLLANVLLALK